MSLRRRPPAPGKEGDLRPVGARALKSAGDTLRPYLSGARVLDLFAGQGRFSLMALEEDCASVVSVERDGPRARQLERDMVRYPDRGRVVQGDVLSFLGRDGEKYDIIFADPPFPFWKDSFGRTLFTALVPRLANDAILLVKCPKAVIPSPAVPALHSWKESPFGESTLRYYRYGEEGEKAAE